MGMLEGQCWLLSNMEGKGGTDGIAGVRDEEKN